MLPSSVESNVEQYLKRSRCAPSLRNACAACSDSAIASPAVCGLIAVVIITVPGTVGTGLDTKIGKESTALN